MTIKTKKDRDIISLRETADKEITFAATHDIKSIMNKYSTCHDGLGGGQILKNRDIYGSNEVAHKSKKSVLRRIVESFINPFTAILFCLAIVSGFTDIIKPILDGNPGEVDFMTVGIIVIMVFISGTLRFVQETKSGNAAEKLLDMIAVTCTVIRNGKAIDVKIDDIVVGDIIMLSVGDMIPADVRIVESKDFFVNQSSLTGESEPIEKIDCIYERESINITDYRNISFMGSNVISGTAKAVAIATGKNTIFGDIADSVSEDREETSFTKGVNKVSMVLIRFMLIMVPIVFIVNGITKGNWPEAFLFGISVAVGLTPEMLPMIVTTCLAKGAVAMSKKKTIVKNLNSIQNFGAIDILCTDKTGTITQNNVVLEYHLNLDGNEDSRVLRHAYLNSYFQTGYRNLMDIAIIKKTEEEESIDKTLTDLSEEYIKVDEIPFDFSRRRLSVSVEDRKGKKQMITKGAVEEMISICSYAEINGSIKKIDHKLKNKILKSVLDLNKKGFRVIAVAQKNIFSKELRKDDENEMVLIGYLAFLDPPKETAAKAIEALKEYGVTTKILTGDNETVTEAICSYVGIDTSNTLLGTEISYMSDFELSDAVEKTTIFAKLSPEQKSRVVTALRNNGHCVGFMGDGINDAPAMKKSDIGISVDTAVDIAKESADIILLENDLMVLEEGIIEGRKTYANMIKYIKMTASSNFGNMFSVLAASALLPFLPMMSIHLIILNLIYDLSCTAIPWDNVDKEYLLKPRKWDASSVGRFMMWIGPTSSIFDWLTYAFMYFILCPMVVSGGVLFNDLATHFSGQELIHVQAAYIAMFQAGWFIESMWSQTLVIHMIRTPKIPFIQSRASKPLTILTFTGIMVLTLIPFTNFGNIIGFSALPMTFFMYLLPCILLYMIVATIFKKAYVKRFGELL